MAYNFEYVKDESGKVTDIKKNGKPVSRSAMRGFRKAQETSFFRLQEESGFFNSPFVGLYELNALELTIVSWIYKWSDFPEYPTAVQTFDDMRMFVLELNPETYSDLID